MPYRSPADQKAWRDAHKREASDYGRQWRSFDNRQRRRTLLRFHGITLEQYNDLLKKQNGACGICGATRSSNGSLSVDHCHEKRMIRGLLCTHCNSLLAMADDDISVLEKAIKYLVESTTSTLKWEPQDTKARYWGDPPNGSR